MAPDTLKEAPLDFLTSIKDADCDPGLNYKPRLPAKDAVLSIFLTSATRNRPQLQHVRIPAPTAASRKPVLVSRGDRDRRAGGCCSLGDHKLVVAGRA